MTVFDIEANANLNPTIYTTPQLVRGRIDAQSIPAWGLSGSRLTMAKKRSMS